MTIASLTGFVDFKSSSSSLNQTWTQNFGHQSFKAAAWIEGMGVIEKPLDQVFTRGVDGAR
jgi:hypothetical protein